MKSRRIYTQAILEQLLEEIIEMNSEDMLMNGRYILPSGAVQDRIRYKIQRLKKLNGEE